MYKDIYTIICSFLTIEDQCCYVSNIETSAREVVDETMASLIGDTYVQHVKYGYINGLNKLLETCYSKPFFMNYFMTLAAAHGSILIYKYYSCKHQANVANLFMEAATYDQVNFIKMLYEEGHTMDINDIFEQAAISGQVEVVKYAISCDTFAIGVRSKIMKYLSNRISWNKDNSEKDLEIYNLVKDHCSQ